MTERGHKHFERTRHSSRPLQSLVASIVFAGALISADPAIAGALVINTGVSAVALDSNTGAYLGSFGSGATYGGITVGPGGTVYWYSEGSKMVVSRQDFSGPTNAFPVGAQTRKLLFGSDGNLYTDTIATPSSSSSGIFRYDATTGALIDHFVSVGANSSPFPGSFAFGPNGDILVNLVIQNVGSEILRFDGTTGASLGTFVPLGTGGVASIFDMEFGPDGNLYASVFGSTASPSGPLGVARYDGTTGAFIDMFIDGTTLGFDPSYGVTGLTFGDDGNFYLIANGAELFKFDSTGLLLTSLGNQMNYQGYFIDWLSADFSVPEPATLTLLGFALAGLGFSRRRKLH